MDALDDEDRTLVERQRVVVLHAAARDEVVARDVDALAADQPAQVVVEQFEVDGFERLVVVVAVLVERSLFAVDEIVVERDHHRAQSQHAEFDAQPLGRGGLAARRRARDEHHADAAADDGVVDGVGDPGELAFVERLGQFDHASGVAREGAGVDLPDCRNAHQRDPRLVLLEDAEHLLLLDVPVERIGSRAQRQGEVEAVVVGLDVEERDVARRGGQRTVEVTHRVVERVELAVKPRPGVQQRQLVGETLLGIAGAHLAREHPLAGDGQVAHGQFAHASLQPRGIVGGEFVDALDLAVEAAVPQRVADVERLPGVEVPDRFLQQEPRGALVDPDAGERGDVDETDRDGGVYLVAELFETVVDERGEERIASGRQAFGDLRQRGSHRDVDLGAEVFTDDFDDVWHNGFSQIMVGKDRKNLYF